MFCLLVFFLVCICPISQFLGEHLPGGDLSGEHLSDIIMTLLLYIWLIKY